jgi:hypothetical protein
VDYVIETDCYLYRGQIKRLEPGGRGQNLNSTNHVNRRGGFQGRRRGNVTGSIGDARLRIIQKNRRKLVDARDKLAEIAKQTDARLKLDKLRENRVTFIDYYKYMYKL